MASSKPDIGSRGTSVSSRLFDELHRPGVVMNQNEFEADLKGEGYEVFYGGLRANQENPEHGHPWHARVMVIGGDITITRDGRTETFHAGDSCMVSANCAHAEKVGPQGVAYIAGRKSA